MYKKITAEEFYKCWIAVVSERKQLLVDNWRNNRIFTSLVIGSEGSLLSSIANKLELKVYENNYYCLDAVFYDDEDLVPNLPPNKFWFRNLKIAFEHENHFNSGLYQEFSHLLITNCDLKVLVSYPNDDESGEKMLNYFTDLILSNTRTKLYSVSQELIVIFGFENNFEWQGYIFKTNKWIKL